MKWVAFAFGCAALSVNKGGTGAAVSIRGGRVELSEDGGVLVMAAMTQVTAGERIEVSSGASIVTVQAAAGRQSNALVIAKGREGQLLWLHNADDAPCLLPPLKKRHYAVKNADVSADAGAQNARQEQHQR